MKCYSEIQKQTYMCKDKVFPQMSENELSNHFIIQKCLNTLWYQMHG